MRKNAILTVVTVVLVLLLLVSCENSNLSTDSPKAPTTTQTPITPKPNCDKGHSYYNGKCSVCGKEWTDIFRSTGYTHASGIKFSLESSGCINFSFSNSVTTVSGTFNVDDISNMSGSMKIKASGSSCEYSIGCSVLSDGSISIKKTLINGNEMTMQIIINDYVGRINSNISNIKVAVNDFSKYMKDSYDITIK